MPSPKKRSDNDITPLFETLAVLDNTKTDRNTRAALPSEQNVVQAKRWVDENEL